MRGNAPTDCCSSAGLGAIALAATVFTMRAHKYAPRTAASSVATHEYLWRASSTEERNSKAHAMIPPLPSRGAPRRRASGRAPRDKVASASGGVLTICQSVAAVFGGAVLFVEPRTAPQESFGSFR